VIQIDRVTKRFGAVTAVDAVSLEVRENEFFALLGPSGCGKTTLLRMLAGFETPDSGRLLLDGTDLVGVKPYRRPLNMMFQSYALFPHMTVRQNVAYGLRMEGVRKADALRRAGDALEQVGLGDAGARRPAQLSGGQRQRVALARALVKSPRLLLLDEPLSALDRQIRGEMQLELKRLQHDVGITFVVVTHDQEEALTMADRIAVMREGRVEQVGGPDALYEAPDTRFVASFLGDANLFGGAVDGASVGPWRVDPARLADRGLRDGDAALIVVRPERLRLTAAAAATDDADAGGTANLLRGRIGEVVYLGTARKYVVDVPGADAVHVRISAADDTAPLTAGDDVVVGWSPADGVVVPGDAAPGPAEVLVHA
jgi:spermidine/putrescine transport system ATP-binding protein/putrescine transport system ATP-binding protein